MERRKRKENRFTLSRRKTNMSNTEGFQFFFFLNDTPVIYEYASAVIGKIARGSVLHDKLFVDILQYGVTSCTHMGL